MCKLRRIIHRVLCQVSLLVIRRYLHIDKIHKNYNSFFIIQLCHQNLIFSDIIAHIKSRRKENSSENHAHRIYRCKTFSPANQIARNRHNDKEIILSGDETL